METVLIVVGDASETVDTLYPFYRLQEDDFTPVVAAPEKGHYPMVLHEVKAGWTITKEWEGYTIEADVAFRDVDPTAHLGIFFSGGRAPEYLRYDEDLIRITRHFFEANKPVACVCTALRSRRGRAVSRAGEWPRCPNAGSTWKSAAAPSSTRRASWTATS
jgi:protease I